MSTIFTYRHVNGINVSIHVLRRGRCVVKSGSVGSLISGFQSTSSEEDVVSDMIIPRAIKLSGFNPRPPKRTLCLGGALTGAGDYMFQSTSSEEDVVSISTKPCVQSDFMFQSTSSEEDVVSGLKVVCRHSFQCFNPRPPKRTLCPSPCVM